MLSTLAKMPIWPCFVIQVPSRHRAAPDNSEPFWRIGLSRGFGADFDPPCAGRSAIIRGSKALRGCLAPGSNFRAPACRTGTAQVRIAILVIAVLTALSGCRTRTQGSSVPQKQKPRKEELHDLGRPDAHNKLLVPPAVNAPAIQESAQGRHGAVSSAEGNASRVGLEILKAGGNAVDAAVAVAFALSVTHPNAGNIGGGGFMVISTPKGEHFALDYRERAPSAATPNMFLDAKGKPTTLSTEGPLAAGIPGNVAGLAEAHRRFGRLTWQQVVDPAVALAKQGWILDSFHADDLAYGVEQMRRLGFSESASLFCHADGSLLKTGDRFKQPALARTLATISKQGWQSFYRGPLAKMIVDEQRALGGIWTLQDLADYRALWREPIVAHYRGHEIISMPPPSAGGVVLAQILEGAEQYNTRNYKWDSPDRAHLYAEVVRRAYVERNQRLGDPDYIDKNWKEMLDRDYIRSRMKGISIKKSTPSASLGKAIKVKESAQTTHFSVVDADRLAVANTFTLNGNFGAKVALLKTGIILNNEMDDFTVKVGEANMFGLVQGAQNAVAPGKRMMSSMTPTIVKKDGKLRAVLGSPGGSTITTTVAQILLQIVDHKRSLLQAVRAPRLHHQWLPDQISVEQHTPVALRKALSQRGHEVAEWSRIGHANCIEELPGETLLRAVADTRRDGGFAAAY